MPVSPESVEQINELFQIENIRKNFGMSKRPKEQTSSMFFKRAYECPEYAYCVFASDDVINAILENTDVGTRKIYVDGTFKICPIGRFSQVLIIFAELLGHVKSYYFLLYHHSCLIN